MAKEKRVYVNKPMLDALRRLMLRGDVCPLCDRDLSEHSWFQFSENGKLRDCSNWEGA